LDEFKLFSEKATADLILPVQRDKMDKEAPSPRAPEAHIMALADFRSCKKKAPYMIHQIFTAKDQWQDAQPGQKAGIVSMATVRSIFAVYHENSQEGQLALLEMFERVRIALLRQGVIGKQFRLDIRAGIEYLVYLDNIYPFYAGEMVTVWKLPPVEREVLYGKQGYSNIRKVGPDGHVCGGEHYGTQE
jgi:hypothetical protein